MQVQWREGALDLSANGARVGRIGSTERMSEELADHAPLWARSCARAVELLAQSGLDKAFTPSRPLIVEIPGARPKGIFSEFTALAMIAMVPKAQKVVQALGDFCMLSRDAAPVESSRHEMCARSTAYFRRMASKLQGVVSGAHAPPLNWDDRSDVVSERLKVVLPARVRDFVDNADLWPSVDARALAIVLHEVGHVVQHARGGGSVEGFFSIDKLGLEKTQAMASLGALEPSKFSGRSKSFANSAFFNFGEGYADLFSAMAMSGGSRDEALSELGRRSSEHARLAPFDASTYGSDRSAAIHDTREAAESLASHLRSGAPMPHGIDAVHALCQEHAAMGTLRWAAAVAACPSALGASAREQIASRAVGVDALVAAAGASRVDLSGVERVPKLRLAAWRGAARSAQAQMYSPAEKAQAPRSQKF